MDKIREIVSRVFKIDPKDIKMEMTPDDIEQWDSLGQLALINALEGEFKIFFDIEEIFEIISIGNIYDILKRKKVI